MVPIAISSGKEIYEDKLIDEILDICRIHHEQKRALAFAFLLYDFSDHTIQKMLRDVDYWASLDAIAGKYLSIFYIDSQDSYFKSRKQEIYLDRLLQNNSDTFPAISYLVPLEPPPTPLEEMIAFIREQFDIQNNYRTPLMVFFQVSDNSIADTYVVSFKEDRLEDSFLEIKRILQSAVDSVTLVLPENSENYSEIFNLITEGIINSKIRYAAKRVIKAFPLSLFGSFLGKLLARY